MNRLLASLTSSRAADYWEHLAFWLLLVLHLLPLWSVRYFLTADGPTHLYNAWLWKTMLLQPGHPAHQVLAFNPNPEPNYLSHVLLAGLLTIVPPWLAEKLVVTLYVVGLPLALRYSLRAGRQESAWLAVLGFPFIYSVVLVWGFYNFCLGLVLLLLVVGYWQRHTGRWRPATIIGLAALLLLLYAAHPMPYVVSGLLLGLLAAATARPRWATLRREFGVLLIVYLPTGLLLGWYFWHKGTAMSQPTQHYGENAWAWLRLEPIHYFGAAESTYRWLVAGMVTAAGGIGLRQLARYPARRPAVLPWALGLLLLLAAYVVLPDAVAGGSVTRPRWGLLSYFALLSGLAAVPWSGWLRLYGLGAGTLVAALLLGFRLQRFKAFQAGIVEYQLAAPYLRPGASVLPIVYDGAPHLPDKLATGTYIPVLLEAIHYLAVERQLLSYGNYEADAGYFPLVWRRGRAPRLESPLLPARLTPFLYNPAHLPTYVLLSNRRQDVPTSPANAAAILAYLARFGYRLHYRSPTGLLELYERPSGPTPTQP